MSLDDKIGIRYEGSWEEKLAFFPEIFEKEGYDMKLVNKYATNMVFTNSDIKWFIKHNISPEEVNKYYWGLYGRDMGELTGLGIIRFILSDYSLNEAKKYPKRFSVNDILNLFEEGCDPKTSKQYPRDIKGETIVELFREGYTPEVLEDLPANFAIIVDKLETDTFNILDREDIINYISSFDDVTNNIENFSFIGSGISSIVLLKKDEQKAWKFNPKIRREHHKLVKIKKANKDLKNIVAVNNLLEDNEGYIIGMELDFIGKESLETKIKYNDLKWEKLSSNKILKYASGIMNGLMEMRKAGIWYHRDIRPANIVINNQDEAVIIDLGIATYKKDALQKDNRRYGAPKQANDLVSLGQIIYKMYTRTHLFAKSRSMEYSIYAENIRDNRDEIYADPKKLKQYLDRVKKRVRNKKIRTLILDCLTAKDDDYEKLHKKFQKYI